VIDPTSLILAPIYIGNAHLPVFISWSFSFLKMNFLFFKIVHLTRVREKREIYAYHDPNSSSTHMFGKVKEVINKRPKNLTV
jgi:hypothetical protein